MKKYILSIIICIFVSSQGFTQILDNQFRVSGQVSFLSDPFFQDTYSAPLGFGGDLSVTFPVASLIDLYTGASTAFLYYKAPVDSISKVSTAFSFITDVVFGAYLHTNSSLYMACGGGLTGKILTTGVLPNSNLLANPEYVFGSELAFGVQARVLVQLWHIYLEGSYSYYPDFLTYGAAVDSVALGGFQVKLGISLFDIISNAIEKKQFNRAAKYYKRHNNLDLSAEYYIKAGEQAIAGDSGMENAAVYYLKAIDLLLNQDQLKLAAELYIRMADLSNLSDDESILERGDAYYLKAIDLLLNQDELNLAAELYIRMADLSYLSDNESILERGDAYYFEASNIYLGLDQYEEVFNLYLKMGRQKEGVELICEKLGGQDLYLEALDYYKRLPSELISDKEVLGFYAGAERAFRESNQAAEGETKRLNTALHYSDYDIALEILEESKTAAESLSYLIDHLWQKNDYWTAGEYLIRSLKDGDGIDKSMSIKLIGFYRDYASFVNNLESSLLDPDPRQAPLVYNNILVFKNYLISFLDDINKNHPDLSEEVLSEQMANEFSSSNITSNQVKTEIISSNYQPAEKEIHDAAGNLLGRKKYEVLFINNKYINLDYELIAAIRLQILAEIAHSLDPASTIAVDYSKASVFCLEIAQLLKLLY